MLRTSEIDDRLNYHVGIQMAKIRTPEEVATKHTDAAIASLRKHIRNFPSGDLESRMIFTDIRLACLRSMVDWAKSDASGHPPEELSESDQKKLMDELRGSQISWTKYQDARDSGMSHSQAIQKLRRFRPSHTSRDSSSTTANFGESVEVMRRMLKESDDDGVKNYEIIVGNIGCVLRTTNKTEAVKVYSEYVEASKDEYGKFSSEPVTLFMNGEPVKEYEGEGEGEGEDEETYAIYRFTEHPFGTDANPRRRRSREYIKGGLTRAEAQAHCSNPENEGDGWFDGFDLE